MNVKFLIAIGLLSGLNYSVVQAQSATKSKTSSTKVSTATKQTSKSNTQPLSVKSSAENLVLSTSKDSLSYALGADVAKSMSSAGFDLNVLAVQKGFKEAFEGEKLAFSEEQITEIIQEGVKAMMEKRNTELSKEGKDFLAKNAQNPNVKVLENGLQYEIITEGTGDQPTLDDEVEVHYEGTLINGEKFDSSYDRNSPLSLRLNSVIEGWKIGIPLMKVGSKYKFYIPHELGYGGRASGPIPAYSTLIFTVELLDIKK